MTSKMRNYVLMSTGFVFVCILVVKLFSNRYGAGGSNVPNQLGNQFEEPSAEFVRAIVNDEMRLLLSNYSSTIGKIEMSLETMEDQSLQWLKVIEYDRRKGMDPLAHTAIGKINALHEKLGHKKSRNDDSMMDSSRTDKSGFKAPGTNTLTSLKDEVELLWDRIAALNVIKQNRETDENAGVKSEQNPDSFHCISKTDASVIVRSMLDTFSADIIGRPDHALQSVGAKIERKKKLTSSDYRPHVHLESPLSWFFSVSQPAEVAIDANMLPGNCWACSLQNGGCNITIKLDTPVEVKAVSIDHISKKIAIDMRSAPKKFRVFGASYFPEQDKDLDFLGEFNYDALHGEQVQTFSIISDASEPNKRYMWVKFEILENHGHPEWTCLYRARVH